MFQNAIITAARAFETLKIPYAIGGSVASGVRGIIRATNDIDFIAAIAPYQAAAFTKELGADFYSDEEHIRASLERDRSFNVIHMPTAFKVDVFPAVEDFHHAQLEHASVATFDFSGHEVTCRVVAAEDVLLAKLRWFQMTGNSSERQWNDLTGVVAVSGAGFDRHYLASWAAKLGITDLLNKALEIRDV